MRFLFYVLKKYAFILVFIVVELISLIWLFNSSAYHRSVISDTFMGLVGSVNKVSDRLSNYTHLTRENDKLLLENAMLREILINRAQEPSQPVVIDSINDDILSVDDVIFDTIQYITKDSLYSFKYVYTPINIIHNSVRYQDNYIMIDKGKKEQVFEDMGLVGTKGLLGVTVKSTQNYSWVMSLLNRNLKLSAKLKSNHMGLVMWEGKHYQYGKMVDVPSHVNIYKGDTIFTTGFSQIFPENIPIGIIENKRIESGSDTYIISFKYIEDFNQLDVGYVIKNMDKKEIDSLLINL